MTATNKAFTLSTLQDEAVCYAYDARGNGMGGVVPTLTGDHENRVTDYTALVVCFQQEGFGKFSEVIDDISPTLKTHNDVNGGGSADTHCFRKSTKSQKNGKGDKWVEDSVTNTINTFENSAVRTAEIIIEVVK